jgi:hypothetical protein
MSVAPVEDFWKSMKGILARLADLSHNLTWSTVNTAIQTQFAIVEDDYQTTTGEPSGRKLSWATMDDEKVCDVCEGNEGEYDPSDEFLPDMPAHVVCRCWWEISAP